MILVVQEGSVMSLLPGFASEIGASPWQPSSAHSPASSASTAMTPTPWQGTHHEAAALAQTGPAALQTPFQQAMHRTGSLQVEAVKEKGTVDSGTEEEAATQEGAFAILKGNGLMGQISLQALLDQSTAPPGFYTGGSRDMPALQDLDRAKSTSYQGVTDIDWRDVVLETKIGAGAFGNVYKATWKGRAVAVKVMLASHGEHAGELESFRQEVQVLSGLQHERIICLLGACLAPPHICIVEELANAGSLFNHLHGAKPGPTRGMPYAQLLQVALDVADALRYLHHHSYPQILHRDLKSSNVLLSGNGRAKVCDFGIAKFKDRTFVSTKHASAGTPAYMAPEMFEGKRISEKIDVFSFGILLWEMLTGQLPWGELSSPMQVIYVVGVLKKRLSVPRHSPQVLRTLIPACWQDDPDLRPTFQTVFPLLQEELEKVRAIAAS
ncbi:g1053 [Coccomyxa viridis]|uniref:G1053 protein n=1 Tax=Coccomyxa viridis TaxID=1274662 RepID=A0ABP1FNZ4_9CHLO